MLPAQIYMTALVFLVPFFLLLYYACNLYATGRITGRRLEGGNILKANLIGGLSFMAVLYMINVSDISRGMLTLFLVINVILTVVERNLVRLVLTNAWKMGLNQKISFWWDTAGRRRNTLTGSCRTPSGDTGSSASWTTMSGRAPCTKAWRCWA